MFLFVENDIAELLSQIMQPKCRLQGITEVC